MSARTDECARCEKHGSLVSNALTEEEKKTKNLMAFQAHLVQAETERHF